MLNLCLIVLGEKPFGVLPRKKLEGCSNTVHFFLEQIYSKILFTTSVTATFPQRVFAA